MTLPQWEYQFAQLGALESYVELHVQALTAQGIYNIDGQHTPHYSRL
jgi:hypothetical protein